MKAIVHYPSVRSLQRLVSFATIASSILFAGCIPVYWLPDSSGFLFVKDDERPKQLIHYDLKTEASRVILDANKGQVFSSNLCTDGELIVVLQGHPFRARITESVELTFYNFAGRELHRSPRFQLIDDSEKEHRMWLRSVPRSRKILLAMQDRSVVYDSEQQTFTRQSFVPFAFHPDGKRFLAYDSESGKRKLFVGDWTGQKHPIEFGTNATDVTSHSSVHFFPWVKWNDDEALFSNNVSININTRKAELLPGTKPISELLDELEERVAANHRDLKISSGYKLKGYWVVRYTDATTRGTVFGIIRPDDSSILSISTPFCFPSPDKSHLAILTDTGSDPSNTIFVLNEHAKIIGQVGWKD